MQDELFFQRPQQFHGKECVSRGEVHQVGHQPFLVCLGQAVAGGHHLAYGALAQPAQPDATHPGLAHQGREQAVEGQLPGNLVVPVGDHEQSAEICHDPGHETQQLQASGVRPVQVLEYQNHGVPSRERRQKRLHLFEERGLAGSRSRPRAGAHHRGRLNGFGTHIEDPALPPGAVGRRGDELVAVPDPHGNSALLGFVGHGGGERRLAYSGLTPDKDEVAPPADGLIQHPAQAGLLPLASEQPLRLPPPTNNGLCVGGRMGGGGPACGDLLGGRRFFQGVGDGLSCGHVSPLLQGRLVGRPAKTGPYFGPDALVEVAVGSVVGVATQADGGDQGLRGPQQPGGPQGIAPRPGYHTQGLQDVGDVAPVPRLLGRGDALREPPGGRVVVAIGEGQLRQVEERYHDAHPVAYAPPQGQPGLELLPGTFVVAVEEQRHPEEGVRLRRQPVLSGLAEERQGLLLMFSGHPQVSAVHRHDPVAQVCVGLRQRVTTDLPGELHELPGQPIENLDVALPVDHRPVDHDRPDAQPRRELVPPQEDRFRPPPSFGLVVAYPPEHVERPAQPRGGSEVVGGERPREGAAQVAVLLFQPVEPPHLLLRPEVGARFFGQGHVERGVPAAGLLGLGALPEAFQGVLPYRLQHPVAGCSLRTTLGHDERFIYERGEQIQHPSHLRRLHLDRLGRLEGPNPRRTPTAGETTRARHRPGARSSSPGSPPASCGAGTSSGPLR